MIHFPCDSCHYEVSAPDDEVGNFMHCPSCSAQLRIPPPKTNEKIEKEEAAGHIYSVREGETGKKYTETIQVVCPICSTLMYAAPERIGSYLSCPDCGTKVQVRPDLQ